MGGAKLEILTNDEIYSIHQSSLKVLANTGVRVYEPSAVDYFRAAGAQVDDESKIVKIPPHVVEESIKKAPREFTLFGEEPSS